MLMLMELGYTVLKAYSSIDECGHVVKCPICNQFRRFEPDPELAWRDDSDWFGRHAQVLECHEYLSANSYKVMFEYTGRFGVGVYG